MSKLKTIEEILSDDGFWEYYHKHSVEYNIPDTVPEFILTDKMKVKENRFFRNYIGSNNIPYPQVDSKFEQTRSRIVVLFFKSVIFIRGIIKKMLHFDKKY